MPAPADLGFVPDAPSADVGFVPDKLDDLGFVPDAAPLKAVLDPYQESRMRTGMVDPENPDNLTDLVAGHGDSNLIRAVGSDVLPEVEPAVDAVLHNKLAKGLGLALTTTGKLVGAGTKATLEEATGNPDLAKQEFSAVLDKIQGPYPGQEETPSPYDEARKTLPLVPRAAASVGMGLVESAPQLALTAVQPEIGAASFGFTPEGFDPVTAGAMLIAPGGGRMIGRIAEKVAAKAGISSDKTLQLINRAGGASGIAGLMSAPSIYQISQMPAGPERDAAVEDSAANAVLVGILGAHGDLKRPTAGQDLGFVPDENTKIPPSQTQSGAANSAPVATGSEVLPPETAKPVETPVSPPVADMSAPATKGDLLDAIKDLKESMTFNPGRQVEPVRTPDGTVDPVQTAIAQMRENVRTPSEPEQPTPAKVQTSQPDTGSTVSPAAVGSEIAQGSTKPAAKGGATSETLGSPPATGQEESTVIEGKSKPPESAAPAYNFKAGDKVIWGGEEHTIKRLSPNPEGVIIGNRFAPVRELKPAPAVKQEAGFKEKANQLALKLEDLKTGIAEGGQLHAFGIAADLWDRAVSIAQKVIRAGGSIADAIAAAIDHIKANHKGVFDEQGARATINEAVRDEAMDRGESEAPKQPPERERSMGQVKSEAADALEALRHASRVSANPSMRGGLSSKEARSAMYLATAKHRLLRDELLHHPDYIAEQLKQQHDAIEEANAILKPHGMAIRPDTFPNPSTLAQVLKPEQVKRVGELQRLIDEAHQELVQMPKKMVTRVHSEMQDDGRLPKSSPIPENAGRTLSKMTAFLRGNKFDSPKGTFAERLALGKRFAARLEGVKNAATKAWLNAQAAWKAMVETYKHPPIDDDFRNVMKHWFEYDQRTSHENYQYVKALTDAVPLPARRAGISVWLDANGDRAVLESQRQQVPEKYAHIWDAALKLTPGEIKIAQQIRADFEAKLDDARSAGLIDKGRENYGVPQRWKVAPEGDANPDPYSEGKKGSPGNPYAKLDPRDPFFSFERKTPSYFDGIMNGGEPENLDVAHLVSVYDESFHKALSSRGAIAALQHAKAKDGLPVVKISGKASAVSTDGGKTYFVDSRARQAGDSAKDGQPYQSIDHWAMKGWKLAFKDEKGNPIIVKGDMLIHPDHFKWLKNELSKPTWTDENSGALGAVTRGGLKANSFLKASKFIGPFHIVTEALHASFHGVVPSVRGFNIDLSDARQALLNRNMTLGFGHAREMFEEGLSSHGGIWGHVPGLGDAVVAMNHFTFNEYIPRLKMKVGLAVLDRNMARYKGKLTDEQIGELTGRQMDAAFGGQNWRLLGYNKNSLIALRLGAVAPDFLLSRSKVIAQAFKPYNAEQRYFLLAQAVGVYTLSRVLNAIFSDDHDPHFEFKNWDSVVIGKRAYHARFLVSDAAALARDLLGLGNASQNGIPFITGRLGVVPKTAFESISGKDLFSGGNKVDELNPALRAFEIVAKDVAEWMTPMGVDGFLPGAAGKGQSGYTSAAAALVGVSSRKETATGDVYNLASAFNRKSDDPATLRYQKERDNSSHGESAYRTLDNLLDAGKMDAAQKAYDALIADGHTPQSIKTRYSHNYAFTGKGNYESEDSREGQFYASLTPQQKKTYDRAIEERQARLDQLEKLTQAEQ